MASFSYDSQWRQINSRKVYRAYTMNSFLSPKNNKKTEKFASNTNAKYERAPISYLKINIPLFLLPPVFLYPQMVKIFLINILVCQDLTSRIHLSIPRNSLGVYLSSEYLFSFLSNHSNLWFLHGWEKISKFLLRIKEITHSAPGSIFQKSVFPKQIKHKAWRRTMPTIINFVSKIKDLRQKQEFF